MAKASSSKSNPSDLELVDRLNININDYISALEALEPLQENIAIHFEKISELKERLTQLGDGEVNSQLAEEVIREIQEMNSAIQKRHTGHVKTAGGNLSRLGNTLNKHFQSSLEGTLEIMGIDPVLFTDPEKKTGLNRVIYEQFLRDGMFQVADTFKSEATAAEAFEDNSDPSIPSMMKRVFEALDAFKNHDMKPINEIISDYHHQFEAAKSPLPDLLLKLTFMNMVKDGKKLEAVEFAQTNFKSNIHDNLDDVQNLFGALVLGHGKGHTGLESKYAAYCNESLWEEGVRIFLEEVFFALGACRHPPFSIIFAAGVEALTEVNGNPTLFKLLQSNWLTLQNMQMQWTRWECECTGCMKDGACVAGDRNFELKKWGPSLRCDPVFHSVFVCPISREGQYISPIAWGYPCGHLISQDSFLSIQKHTPGMMFKCPICLQPFISMVGFGRPVSF